MSGCESELQKQVVPLRYNPRQIKEKPPNERKSKVFPSHVFCLKSPTVLSVSSIQESTSIALHQQ